MKKLFFITILFLTISIETNAQEGFLGEVKLFAGNFAPRNWAFCHGQLLSISQNTALFSILGTTYGGDGRTTFGLPDLRSRVPVGTGRGPGLPDIKLGEKFGASTTNLTSKNLNLSLPIHEVNPGGETLSKGNTALLAIGNSITGSMNLGAGQEVNNMQPSLGMNYIICLQGIFPSRN